MKVSVLIVGSMPTGVPMHDSGFFLAFGMALRACSVPVVGYSWKRSPVRERIFLALRIAFSIPIVGHIFQADTVTILVRQVAQSYPLLLAALVVCRILLHPNIAFKAHMRKMPIVDYHLSCLEVDLVADVGEVSPVLGEYAGHGPLEPVPSHCALLRELLVGVVLAQKLLGLGAELADAVPVVVAAAMVKAPREAKPLCRRLHDLGW
jgi:hypothetical protein